MARRVSTSRNTSGNTVGSTPTSTRKPRSSKQDSSETLETSSSLSTTQWVSPLSVALERLIDGHTYRNRDGFSISQLGNCFAQQLFGVAGFTKGNPPAARTLLTWRAGNDGEVEIYRLLEQVAGYTIVGKQKEVIGQNPPREGHLDGFILLDDGRLWPFDAKTANGRSFDEWTQQAGVSKWANLRDGLSRFDPRFVPGSDYRPVKAQYESYYYQAQGYLELINSRDEYKSYRIDNMPNASEALTAAAVDGAVPISGDGFYFFVLCKDDSRLYEEFVPYDAEEIRGRLDKLADGYGRIKETTDEARLAEIIREYREVERKSDGKLHWKCNRCPFVKVCWDEV